MDDIYEPIKGQLLTIMGELDAIKVEIGAFITNVDDVKAMVDEVLRQVCGADVVADADRMMAAKARPRPRARTPHHAGTGLLI
ncbi:MAG: hypothetical protein MZV70_03430 [Desulfobacterales bacterium]|nr:hypothetical protein [Desulfobacterales bacterium]